MRENILFLSLFFILSYMQLTLFNYIQDDAYIHFRIAENLVNSGLPYFNLNEPFMSSSSSLWTIFLALNFSLIGTDYITYLPIINSLFTVLSLYVFLKILENYLERKLRIFEILIFIFSYLSILMPSSIGLMETPLTILIVSLSIYLLMNNKLYGFALLTFAVFLRLEIAIFLIIISLIYMYKNPKNIFQITLIIIIASMPFIIYDLYFFKTLLPLTAKAKSIVYDLSILSVAMTSVPSAYGLIGKIIEVILIFIILFFILKNKENIKFNLLTIYFLSGVLLLAAYILKSTFLFGWYLPLYLIPIFLYLSYAVFKIDKPILLVLLILVLFPFYKESIKTIYASITADYSKFSNFKSGARVQKYLEISKQLYLKYPNVTLLTSEIGGLGYGFKGYILDGMGLIQPLCLKYHPMSIPNQRSSGGIGAIPVGCVKEVLPEIIVSYDIFIESLSKNNILGKYNHYIEPIFTSTDMKLTTSHEIWGSTKLNIYIRKDIDKGL